MHAAAACVDIHCVLTGDAMIRQWVVRVMVGFAMVFAAGTAARAQQPPDTVPRGEYDQLKRDMQRMQDRMDALEKSQGAVSTRADVEHDAKAREGDTVLSFDLKN